MTSSSLTALAVAAAGLLAACTPVGETTPPAASAPPPAEQAVTQAGQLEGAPWSIFEIDGQPLLPDTQADIGFADGRAAGNGSCNRYFGSYETDGESGISFGQMASTMMACPEGRMQQEDRLLKLLPAITSRAIGEDGVLTLTTADGRTLKARRQP